MATVVIDGKNLSTLSDEDKVLTLVKYMKECTDEYRKMLKETHDGIRISIMRKPRGDYDLLISALAPSENLLQFKSILSILFLGRKS